MTESSYTAKLEFISVNGDNVSIDYISFHTTAAVEANTWGSIKSFYR